MDFASHAPRAWFVKHSHALGMLAMRPMHLKMRAQASFQGEYRNSPKAPKLPSSGTATFLNDQF